MADDTTRRARRTLRRRASNGDNGNGSGALADGGRAVDIGGLAPNDSDADHNSGNDSSEIGGNERVNVGTVEIDPEQLGEYIAGTVAGDGAGDGAGEGTGKRKYTKREGGEKQRRRRKETSQDIAPILTMLHTWGSVFLKAPELMLSPAETKAISDAYAVFCEHHEVPLMTAKRMSEITLITTLLAVYGTRVVAITKRVKTERAQRNDTQAQQYVGQYAVPNSRTM